MVGFNSNSLKSDGREQDSTPEADGGTAHEPLAGSESPLPMTSHERRLAAERRGSGTKEIACCDERGTFEWLSVDCSVRSWGETGV